MTRSVTALQMLQDGVGVGRLSFGCRNLDQCTRGGIPTQGINEIVGEAGAGKTQYALTLSLQCHLPLTSKGLGGDTAYLCCGEGTFPVRRLEQLARSFEKKSGIPYTKFMESVHIEQCHNADDVLDTVVKKLPQMCASKGIRLIVIDSIAGMVRSDYDSNNINDMAARTTLLFRLAKELKWLSDIHKTCIVVINQVTAKGFQYSDNDVFQDNGWSSDSSNPALGLAWTHCVNARIRLRRDSRGLRGLNGGENDESEGQERKENYVNNSNTGVNDGIIPPSSDNNNGNSNKSNTATNTNQSETILNELESTISTTSNRLLTLEFSPCNQKSSCRYRITNDGVFGLS